MAANGWIFGAGTFMLTNDRQAPNPPLHPRFKGYFPIHIRAFVPTFLFFLFLYLSSNHESIYSPTRADRILPQSYRVHYVFPRLKITDFEPKPMDR